MTRRLAALAAVITLAGAPALAATPADRATDSPAAAPRAAGPTIARAAVAARLPRAERSNAEALARLAPERKHHGSAVALMTVGGAGVLLGLLVGGDAETPLVVGGAVVGLIGLYRYLL